MDFHHSPQEAVQIQNELKSQIRLEPYIAPLKLIGGADVSFNKYSPTIYAGFVVLDFQTLEIVDRASAIMDVDFPYIPGLLSFREIPPLLKAWENLKTKPDVMMFDGQGIAHPRRLGIASHAGLLLDIPSIGCAKSLLTGTFETPGPNFASQSPLLEKKTKEQIGVVFRTKNKVNPVFISPGHRMDFESAVRITQACVRKHRIPEPTRQAHLYVNEVRRAQMPT
ncbi:MAG: deoxyribonuclease V [Pseudobdellovibrionaceae bacterium]